jgi:acetyl-CoA acyltransferase
MDAVIVDAVRTPVGRAHAEKGVYRDTHPVTLLQRCLEALIERTGVDPGDVEDVVCGCTAPLGEQSRNIGRNAWLAAGYPAEIPAVTLDRRCGSAQAAVSIAASAVASGMHDLVIACGVEHMGHIPISAQDTLVTQYGSPYTQELLDRYDFVSQGISAELIAERWDISREEMDALAVESHRRAARADFTNELVPIETPHGLVTSDQGIRPDTNLETLSQLKPAFKPDGKITAGNSSQISDGAAAVMLTTPEKAAELGLRPRARIVDQTTVGCDPVKMLEGPIPATAKLLERNGMSIGDIDRFEVNEAFAPVVIAWSREHNPDMDRVNVRGGAMALGHPLGSTGARLITTLLHTLEDEDKEIGLVTMCCGGGLGTGTIIQRV